MLDSFADWVERNVANYLFSLGELVEDKSDYQKYLCVVQQTGGASPIVDVRFPRYRVFLLGPRNDRGASKKVYDDSTALVNAVINHTDVPCRAAGIKIMGEPTGPHFTKEGRAWVQLDFEIIY